MENNHQIVIFIKLLTVITLPALMKKLLNISLVLMTAAFVFAARVSAQDNAGSVVDTRKVWLFYKDLYKSADSIHKLGQQGVLNKGAFAIADSLDNLSPESFFMTAGKLMSNRHYNEASFIFFLGNLRFRYYNLANPNYKPADGGALLASLNYEIGEPLQMFLTVDLDNFIAILKASSNWALNHDYKYFSKDKSPQKYSDQLNGINALIAGLDKNRENYTKAWTADRVEMEKNIDSMLAQKH